MGGYSENQLRPLILVVEVYESISLICMGRGCNSEALKVPYINSTPHTIQLNQINAEASFQIDNQVLVRPKLFPLQVSMWGSVILTEWEMLSFLNGLSQRHYYD